MTITVIQKNGSASTGTLNATPPAWSPATTAGNLLLVVGHETGATNSTWPTTPAGYTAFASTPFVFATTAGSLYGIFWKIAAGADATPGAYGETSGTQDWVTYTYEFNSTTGWLTTPNDGEAHSAASNTAATTKSSGSTATLAQADELGLAVMGASAAVTALSFATSTFTTIQPTTNNGKLWVGWLETAATTALGTTASWTTSTTNGCRVATFEVAAAAAAATAVNALDWTSPGRQH